MTTIELAMLVKSVRDLQERYRDTPDGEIPAEAVELERRLEEAVDAILGEAAFASGGREWADWNAGMLDCGD